MVERNAMRSTRNQPFCWQEKKINRLIRKIYKENKAKMSKMLLLYQTLTEIDSDFNGQNINFYTKTIVTYSGLNKDLIPKFLKELEELQILEIEEIKVNGKFAGKNLIFTPHLVVDPDEKFKALNKANSTVTENNGNGDNDTGNSVTENNVTENNNTEKSGTLEDNTPSENINNKNNNIDSEKIDLLLNDNGIKDKKIINEIISKCNYKRVKEVVDQCYKKDRESPSGFIIDALQKGYEFKDSKKSIDDKYEIKKNEEKLKEDKKIAQALKSEHEKKLLDDWIINNKASYENLIKQETESYNKKYENSSFKPKDPSYLIKTTVRGFIKNEILGI